MSSVFSKLRVFIYGKNIDSINDMKKNFSDNYIQTVILDNEVTERKIVNYCLKRYTINGDYMFVNADTMKKVHIMGFNSINNSIEKIKNYIDDDKYVILFHRYNDSGINSHYLTDILYEVSVFRSYKPGNSDCFLISEKAVEFLKDKSQTINYYDEIKKRVRYGEFDCLTFNPNLFTFRIEDSDLSAAIHQSKCSMLKSDESTNFNDKISIYFSSHMILFWIFFVFIICAIFTVLVKLIGFDNIFFCKKN